MTKPVGFEFGFGLGMRARARARSFAVNTALTLALAACGSGGPVADASRPRIVSLNPCTDAVLAEVAAPGQLLAISHYSQDPSATSMDITRARQFAAVSGSVEEIAALKPDVVVASSFLAPSTAQALRDLGIRVVLEPIPSDVPQALAQVRTLAALTGNHRAGEALVRRIDLALAEAAPKPGSARIPALVWQSGGIVAGEHTLVAELLGRSGFVNAAAARGLAQADYLPLERVLTDPPRVIFTVGSPAAEEDRMLRHPALAHLTGVTRAPLDSSLLWCGGPTIPRALARLAQVRASIDASPSTPAATAAMNRVFPHVHTVKPPLTGTHKADL
jgi:iron complex transport system substrate-binding protein